MNCGDVEYEKFEWTEQKKVAHVLPTITFTTINNFAIKTPIQDISGCLKIKRFWGDNDYAVILTDELLCTTAKKINSDNEVKYKHIYELVNDYRYFENEIEEKNLLIKSSKNAKSKLLSDKYISSKGIEKYVVFVDFGTYKLIDSLVSNFDNRTRISRDLD